MPETRIANDKPVGGTRLRGRDVIRETMPPLLGRARREVVVFAAHPEPSYLDTEPFVAELAAFVARHRQNRARLLVDDPARLAREHVRLAEALRRVSDSIEVREIAEHDRGRSDLFVLVDGREYLVLEDCAGIEGRAGDTRREAIALAEAFEAMWERGIPAALRPLGL
jgi:hypothetical protein